MTHEINLEGTIKEVTLSQLKEGFALHKNVANILKWSLLGLYIKNDEEEIKELEECFKKTGALYDKRAYKSEAKALYRFLMSNNELVVDKEVYTVEKLSSVRLDNMPFSIGIAYKALPKAEKKTSLDSDLRKIAKVAIDSPHIDTGDMKAKQLLDMSNGVMGNEFIDIANNKLDQARSEYTLAQAQATADKALATIPAYNLDKEAFMATLKGMISQVHAFEGDLTPITDFIMELQTTPQEQVQAA